ncbi:MAG: metal-dependent transcriptional regulator [Candidatus Methanoliparum thermophilum]|uniref:Metal-dependent transcriptional regulator n=1 Tax=Methanoliparum thermophilum TaxID=2491083 RepID=A0A520KTL9_METT2|nr:metal-dependent transcriptional regulator [Candidatus Methanoliparum sp. LAM-1]RZN65434.1 MAG: metal-dependent transcriptional regulator [Candidatus Methanoliparum thermophilum]BDC35477.1 DNA-binding protein [Candidatus Methanoliparum sp. LAM-1]
MLSKSEEEYLEAMYDLMEEGERLSTKNISERLDVSMASTSEMVKKLSKKGFLDYKRYKNIELTNKGFKKAKELKRKHRLLETFLSTILKRKEIHNEACELEHAISRESTDALCKYLSCPTECPDGKTIPKCDDKNCDDCFTSMLDSLEIGQKAKIIDFLCGKKAKMRLNELGLVPGNYIEVINKISTGPVKIKVKQSEIAIGKGLAKKILVKKDYE